MNETTLLERNADLAAALEIYVQSDEGMSGCPCFDCQDTKDCMYWRGRRALEENEDVLLQME